MYLDLKGQVTAESQLLMEEKFNKELKTRHTFLSKNCMFIYHLGIIDYLQDYHFEKKLENFVKEDILGQNSKTEEISAVPPKRYAPRFLQFMASNVVIDQGANRSLSVKKN